MNKRHVFNLGAIYKSCAVYRSHIVRSSAPSRLISHRLELTRNERARSFYCLIAAPNAFEIYAKLRTGKTLMWWLRHVTGTRG